MKFTKVRWWDGGMAIGLAIILSGHSDPHSNGVLDWIILYSSLLTLLTRPNSLRSIGSFQRGEIDASGSFDSATISCDARSRDGAGFHGRIC